MKTADFPKVRENGFDFEHDYGLIVASFAAAYGLRIRNPDTKIPWREFQDLLNNLPGDMPLPMMIFIRKSTDKELEYMSESAKKAREDWYLWISEQEIKTGDNNSAENLEALFQSMFGGEKKWLKTSAL